MGRGEVCIMHQRSNIKYFANFKKVRKFQEYYGETFYRVTVRNSCFEYDSHQCTFVFINIL